MTRSLSMPILMLSLMLVSCTQSAAPPDPPAADDRPSPQRSNATNNALAGQHWLLQDATDAQGLRIDALLVRPTQPLQFDFVDGHVRIVNACNGIRGDVRIDGDSLRFGPLVSTKMACADPAVMALDGEVAKRLEARIRFRLLESDPPQLMLTTANGDTLRFVGTGTPEDRFGSPGTIVFMEVAAHIKPCQHPMMPSLRQCLEVRELHYDADGLRSGTPGEWQLFHDTIEGYTHEDGVRNVLRIKRFPIANPPMDAPATGYVLDMVVESETVDP
jgi:heat shock protein HslJ